MHAQVYYLLHNIFVTVAGHGLLDQKKFRQLWEISLRLVKELDYRNARTTQQELEFGIPIIIRTRMHLLFPLLISPRSRIQSIN